MALINCPECNSKISNKALYCPKCGYPMEKENAKEEKGTSKKGNIDLDNVVKQNDIKDKNYYKPIKTKNKNDYFSLNISEKIIDGISNVIGIALEHEYTSVSILNNKKTIIYKYPSLNNISYNARLSLLIKIKKEIEIKNNCNIKDVFFGIPNKYGIKDRIEINRLCSNAGFSCCRITNLTTASLVSINTKLKLPKNNDVLVLDFNHEQCDVLVADISGGAIMVVDQSYIYNASEFRIKKSIISIIVEDFLSLNDINIMKYSDSMNRIEFEIDKSLKDIFLYKLNNIYIPNIYSDGAGTKNINIRIDSTKIDKIVDRIIVELKAQIDKLINLYNIGPIILTGWIGSIPAIKKFIFDNYSSELYFRDSDSIHGLAYMSGWISNLISGFAVIETLPFGIGVENAGNITNVIPKGTIIPVTRSYIFGIAEDNQRAVEVNVVEECNNGTYFLGKLKLDNLPLINKDSAKIEIGINISINCKITAQIRLHDSDCYNTIDIV